MAMPGVRGRWRGTAYVAAAALLLSSAGLFIKVLNLGAFQINFYRSLVAALTIVVVRRLRGQPVAFRLDPLSLACYLTYAAMPILFVASTMLTTAANAIFLQYTAPIFLLFMEPWLDKRPVSHRELGAVAAGVGGIFGSRRTAIRFRAHGWCHSSRDCGLVQPDGGRHS